MSVDRVRARLDALKNDAPSADARARMFAGVTGQVRARRRARIAIAATGALTVIALAVLLGRSTPTPTLDGVSPAPIAEAPTPEVRDLHRLARAETFELAHATLIARNDTAFELRGEELVLDEGSVTIDGSTWIEGGSCQASIEGRCQVTRFEHSLRFIVEAGAVELRSPVATCDIVLLEEPATPEVEEDTEPEAEAHTPRPRPVDPTELAAQTEAYRQALALLGHDDAAALAALRAMQTRWPRGSLSPEVDFQIVRVLVRTGSDADVRTAARAFVRRHPRSARAAEMQHLISEPMDPEGE
jgi:hypothetical protein